MSHNLIQRFHKRTLVFSLILCSGFCLTRPLRAQENPGLDLRQLGQLANWLDSNHDGIISPEEMQAGLNGAFGGGTAQNPFAPGQQGPSFQSAQQTLLGIESRKMKADAFGRPDPQTGLFKPEEANQLIRAYLEREVMAAQSLSLRQKFELLKPLRMEQDSFQRYNPFKGALKHDEMASLALKAATYSRPDPRRPESLIDMLNVIHTERFQADSFGRELPHSGLFANAEANRVIKQLLSTELLNYRQLSPEQKIAIIQQHIMRKDNFGRDLVRTGALTLEEAQFLMKQVLASPSTPSTPNSPWNQDPFKPSPSDKPWNKDPFKE